MKLKSILVLSILGLMLVGVFGFLGSYNCSALMGNCTFMSGVSMAMHHLSGIQNFTQNLIVSNSGLSIILIIFLVISLLFSIKLSTDYSDNDYYWQKYIREIKLDFSFKEKILNWLSFFNVRYFDAFLRARVLAN